MIHDDVMRCEFRVFFSGFNRRRRCAIWQLLGYVGKSINTPRKHTPYTPAFCDGICMRTHNTPIGEYNQRASFVCCWSRCTHTQRRLAWFSQRVRVSVIIRTASGAAAATQRLRMTVRRDAARVLDVLDATRPCAWWASRDAIYYAIWLRDSLTDSLRALCAGFNKTFQKESNL